MEYLSLSQLRTRAAFKGAPVSLYENWFKDQTACIIGDNPDENTDMAIDIAASVALSGHKVLFVDFRHNSDRFLDRTASKDTGNIFYGELDLALVNPGGYDSIWKSIDGTLKESGADICVIDSLSVLCTCIAKTDAARYFLRIFHNIGVQRGISFLFTATPRKRIGKSGIVTRDHLPRFTEPYFRTIIPTAHPAEPLNPQLAENPNPQPAENPNLQITENSNVQIPEDTYVQILENEVGTRHGASAPTVSAKVSEPSEQSEQSSPPAPSDIPSRPPSRAERRRAARKAGIKRRFLP